MNKNKQSRNLDISENIEFYHRRWIGGGLHTLGNNIAGAFGITKKEWNRKIEERNRNNKALKKKLQSNK